MINFDFTPEPKYIQIYKNFHLDSKSICFLLKNSKLRTILSNGLNYEQIIPNEDGLHRDYRGLSELFNMPFNEIRNLDKSRDPISNILVYLDNLDKKKLNNNSKNEKKFNNENLIDNFENDITDLKKINSTNYDFFTIEKLMHSLEKIERFDIIDDFLEELKSNPLKDDDNLSFNFFNKNLNKDYDQVFYDAYVCYADCDLPFVQALSDFLESPNINLKLFIRDRDLLLGSLEYDTFTELIEKKCNRLLIVLSPEFLNSPECEFQTTFTFSLQVQDRQRKLIPIIYKACEIPLIIRFLSKIDLSKGDQTPFWTWKKLVMSLSNDINIKNKFLTNETTELLNREYLQLENELKKKDKPISETIDKLQKNEENFDELVSKKKVILNETEKDIISHSFTSNKSETCKLIEKQKNFKILTKIWKKISISSIKR